MTEHSDDCAATGVMSGDGDEARIVDGPCSCGLEKLLAVVREAAALRDAEKACAAHARKEGPLDVYRGRRLYEAYRKAERDLFAALDARGKR